jgi:hypothetical protein
MLEREIHRTLPMRLEHLPVPPLSALVRPLADPRARTICYDQPGCGHPHWGAPRAGYEHD